MGKDPAETSRYGKYLLLDRIGRGGMSEVFLAKTEGIEGFERKVALKRIFPSLTENPEFVQSFIHEARIGGMLYHHNVVQTLDFGKCDDTYFIALEYVEGTNLGKLLSRCRTQGVPLPPGIFLQIALQICEGLDYIHHASTENTELKLVHRDIKPSNMLITAQAVVKISDFGVAKAEARGGSRTSVGSLKGTVGYMSPEQARGEKVGPSSDLFSLGAMLLEMATRKRLYGEGDVMTVLQRVKDSAFRVPIENAAAYIPGLDRVLKRMMAPSPQERYPEVSQASAALRALPVRVADRPALVEFCKSLDVFDFSRESRNADYEPSADSITEQSGSNESAKKDGVSGKLKKPGRPQKGIPALPETLQTILFVLLTAVLGVGAALGSYHLVDARLARSSIRTVVPLVVPPPGDNQRRQPVEVLVQSFPPGAEVLVDGTQVAPSTPVKVAVFPGQEIRLRLEGYQDWRQLIEDKPAQAHQEWVVTLVAQQ